MKFQLWSTDEYGQTSILQNADDYESLLERAKSLANSANVDNVLTAEEKLRNWEAALPTACDEYGDPIETYLFAGRSTTGAYVFYDISDGTPNLVNISEVSSQAEVRFYLGNLDGEDWYAKDEYGKFINNIKADELKDKTLYAIKAI